MTNTQRVAEIRKEMKATFPGYKFSITCDHYYGVNIYVLSAPYAMTDQRDEQVNQFHFQNHYTGRKLQDVTKIWQIANRGVKYRETGDYGTQPDFYVSIGIGKWDKPFQNTGA